MDFDLTPARSDVFKRLFADSEHRRSAKNLPEPSVEKPTGPRSKIEEDLMERQKALKAKLRNKTAEMRAKEREECTGVPSINPVSRRIAESNTPEKDSVQVKMVASSLRNKKRTMDTSCMSATVLDVKVNLSRHFMESTQLQASPVHGSRTNFDHIKERLDSGKPEEEAAKEEPRYLMDEKDVVKRAIYWNSKRLERIKKQREEKERRETDGCTFKPESFHLKRKSAQLKVNESEKKIDRCNLSPSRSRVGYANGFDEKNFVKRSQPMLGYTQLAPEL